jgi:hypothetical protein
MSTVTTGSKAVIGYWNGTGRSAVEVANVASGNGTLTLMKNGGVVVLGGGIIAPAADSTTALKLTKADGTTAVLTVDTTNSRVGIGTSSPQQSLDVGTGKITGGTSSASFRNTLDLSSAAFAAMDFTFAGGGIFRPASVAVAGVPKDLFFQLLPETSSGYGYIEAWAGAGLMLGTGNGTTPIVFRVNRVEVARITSTGALQVAPTDAATAAVTDVMILDHSTSGTPAAVYGTGLRFRGQSSTTASRDMGRVRTEWTTATDASRASKMVLSAYAIGVETDVLSLASDGGITLLNSGNSSIRGGGTIGYMKLRSTSTLGIQIVAENTGQVPLMVYGMTSHVTSIQQWLDNTTGSNVLTSIPAGGGVRVHSDPGSGAASTTTLTNATGTPVTPGTPAGYIKVYIGTVASYIPYYQ